LLCLRSETGAALILLDLMMPRLSGADFIKALRADSAVWPASPC
jgi:CheY-like chemotaxis protein